MAYTANFLTVNGLNLPAMSAGRRRSDVDKWGRGNGVDMSGATFARKRQFAFETPPMTPLEAHALSGWVRGLGHHFTFEWLDEHLSTTKFTLYSTDGGAVISGGSTATADTKYGSYALLAAGNDTHTVTALFGSETPHGFSVWRKQLSINTWELCSAAYDGATARYFAGPGGTSITTAFAWTTFLHTTGYLRVGLEGQNAAGSSATCLYDGLMILPYSPTSAQLYARHQRLNTEPGFPLVAVGGHLHQAIPEVAAKGFVKSYPVHQVVLDRPRDNARQVVGTLVESRPLTSETVLPTEPVPTLEELILDDPDLFIYYPLDDASAPGTVADLGPGGYDLTVSNPQSVITWGNAGPTAEIPTITRFDMTWARVVAGDDDNYLYRAQASGPVMPTGSFTLSFVGRPQDYSDLGGQPGRSTVVTFYRPGAPACQVEFVRSGSQVIWYVGSTNATFTDASLAFGTTAQIYTFVLDLSLGTYGRIFLYVNGVEIDTFDLVGVYSQYGSTQGIVIGANPNATAAPPTATDLSSPGSGALGQIWASGRAYSAAEVLAFAEAAGFA